MTQEKLDHEEFIEVFNDMETYPTVKSVAEHFQITPQKVSQTANRLRRNGEPVINRRTKNQELAGTELTEDEHSTITFYLDEDLSVSVKSSINLEKMKQVLLDNGYINHEDVGDEGIYHMAFIVIANEITTQLISEYTV